MIKKKPKQFEAQRTIKLNISWPSNVFVKIFMGILWVIQGSIHSNIQFTTGDNIQNNAHAINLIFKLIRSSNV